MAKAKKNKPARRRPADPEARRRVRAVLTHAAIALSMACVLGAGVKEMREYVDRDVSFPTAPPHVTLVNRPAWMSDALAAQILREARPLGLHSSYDHQLLVDTCALLKADPWVKNVRRVRRAYANEPGDTLEIDCEYRVPAAVVRWDETYWLVDSEGVKLPEEYTAAQLPRILTNGQGGLNVRAIEGVAHAAVEAGQPWPGADLAAGLEMARLLADQPFAKEIGKIDVSNFAGRREPREAQIVLWTQHAPPTQIRWGRPPSAADAFIEVSAAQKLDTLKMIDEQYHRVDGNQPWLDVRFENVTCPRPLPAPVAAPPKKKR